MLQIEPQAIRIPAHSKRQAMDWSLLLLSQGIESIIDHSDESGWGLVVSSNEHQRALRLIKTISPGESALAMAPEDPAKGSVRLGRPGLGRFDRADLQARCGRGEFARQRPDGLGRCDARRMVAAVHGDVFARRTPVT